MQTEAKILFYNPTDGHGIVITRDKLKFDFNAAQWDDFDTLPQTGIDVLCVIEADLVRSIVPAKAPTPAQEFSQNLQEAQTPQEEVDNDKGEENSLALWEKNRQKIDSIRLSVPVNICIEHYFKQIDEDINERTGYKNAQHRLDYLKMRRFLFTMYNNLTELDMHFITPRIKIMRDDLLEMSSVYDDFRSKATYPEIAFEKVFLSRQEEYQRVKAAAELAHSEYLRLQGSEERLSEILGEKEEVLERTLHVSPVYERLNEEHKELKSDYVDTVHMMATLDEAYRHDTEVMMVFEQEHKEHFFELFSEASYQYREQIIKILDAQAFLFDEQLWMQAQKSKVIRNFFETSHIKGEYCSKTFLRYYLNSLDPEKISAEQRELFKLYDYLDSISKNIVVVVVKEMDEAFYYKSLFAQMTMPYEYHVYIDSQKAFAWLQKHRVSLIIVAETLDKMSGASFVRQFQEKIGSRSCCALIGDESKQPYEPFDAIIKNQVRAGEFKERLENLLKEDHG